MSKHAGNILAAPNGKMVAVSESSLGFTREGKGFNHVEI